MKELLNIKRFKLYGWVGLGIVCMCTIQELSDNKGIVRALLDCFWLTSYLTLVNYVLYDIFFRGFDGGNSTSGFYFFCLTYSYSPRAFISGRSWGIY